MLVIGHRGARGLAPENTIASFQKALEHHVDAVELDVRLSSDVHVVVHHDSFITDPSGGRRDISEHALAELRQHKPDLATLEEAITAINRQVPVFIEVKPGVPTGPVIKIIKTFLRRGWQTKDFSLVSRNMPILEQLHEQLPEIEIIVIDFWSGVRATRRARKLNTRRIGMLEYWLWPGFIKAMKQGGYELYSVPPGTAQKERLFARLGLSGQSNTPARARRWARYGLAGVFTDYPDRYDRHP